MKKCLILLLCLLLTLCSCSTNTENTANTVSSGSNDPAGTKTIYVYDIQKQEITVAGSTTAYEMRYIYDENGFLSAIESEANGEALRISVACNEDGLMTKTSDPAMNQDSEYTYDAQGNLRSFTMVQNGELVNSTSYAYDAQGLLTKQETVYEKADIAMTIVYFYENGLQVRAETYQADVLFSITTMQHNAQGLCIEAVQTGPDGTVLIKTTYAYDAQGNVIEVVQYTYSGGDVENPAATTRTCYTYKAIEVPADSPRIHT